LGAYPPDEADGVDLVARDAAVEDDDVDLVEKPVKHLVELFQAGGADGADVVLVEQQGLVVANHCRQVVGNQYQRFVVDGHCSASKLCVQPRAGCSIGLNGARWS